MDLLSGYGAISSQIDTLWNIFMLVHLTLFAGLWKLEKKNTIGRVEWIGLLTGYCVFAYLNWNALRGDYYILDHIAQDISRYSGEELKKAFNTIGAIGKQKPRHRTFVVSIVHIGAALFIIVYSIYLSRGRKFPLSWREFKQPDQGCLNDA